VTDLARRAARLEPVLAAILPAGDGPLERAMRYAVLGGGKRLRPVLALAAAEAAGLPPGSAAAVEPAACALELIHAYSLVHDDLPAMDDAEQRRGKAACHRVFGEALAVLAGDALLTLAFDVLGRPVPGLDPARQVEAIRVVAAAAGAEGMVGGQARDVAGVPADEAAFTDMVRRKTGALFLAAVRLGAILAGVPAGLFDRYGAALGLAFQIADDLMDGDGFAALLGPEAARARARQAAEEAVAAVAPLGERGRVLADLARFAVERPS
jgi:farnesyl diphosphate synthase